MSGHEHYEQLCAILATGQITDDELQVLKTHLASCCTCADLAASFGRLGGEIVLERASRSTESEMRGVRSRFLARAREQGIDLPVRRNTPAMWLRVFRFAPVAFAAAAVLLFAVFAKSHPHTTNQHIDPSVNLEAAKSSASAATGSVASPELLASVQKLTRERDEFHKAITWSEVRKTSLEATLSKLTEVGEQQQKEFEGLKRNISDLNAQKDGNALQLVSALNGLEKAKDELVAANVQLAIQQHQLTAMTDEAHLAEAKYEREKVVSSAGKDGHSILAARNLHIIDVYDVNGQGKRQKAFGRVFYVEDRELVFYAYDLASMKHKDTRFYAWGSGHGESPYVARLGVLHNDGNGEGRWELRFNDGGVLAKVDSVFVTAEESDAQAPKGKRVLVAVLGDQPNHP